MAYIDLLEITKPNDDKAKTQKAPSNDSAFWVWRKLLNCRFICGLNSFKPSLSDNLVLKLWFDKLFSQNQAVIAS